MPQIDSNTLPGFLMLLILAISANYGLTLLVTVLHGPWDMFEKVRIRAGAYLVDANKQPKPTELGKLLSCPYCLGVWTSALTALIIFPISILTIFIWLTIFGIQSFMHLRAGE